MWNLIIAVVNQDYANPLDPQIRIMGTPSLIVVNKYIYIGVRFSTNKRAIFLRPTACYIKPYILLIEVLNLNQTLIN